MKILFLGDVVGISGCSKILRNLKSEVEKRQIDFVIVNGENSAEAGVGITEEICKDARQGLAPPCLCATTWFRNQVAFRSNG